MVRLETLQLLEKIVGAGFSVLHDVLSLQDHIFVDSGGVLSAMRAPKNIHDGLLVLVGVQQQCVPRLYDGAVQTAVMEPSKTV